MRSPDSEIGQEAAEWLADLEQPDVTDRHPDPVKRRQAFLQWLARSPEHARTFSATLQARRRLTGIDQQRRIDVEKLMRMRTSADVVPLYQTLVEAEETPRRPAARILPLAAAAMLILVIAAVWLWAGLRNPSAYVTAVGEQHTYKLRDGSVVILNTGSRIEVEFSNNIRNVRLVSGEAIFTVEHDLTRPFIVHAGNTTVRALGTTFDVRRRGAGSTDISVVEGAVQVASSDQAEKVAAALESPHVTPSIPIPLQLQAGEAARVENGHISRRAHLTTADELAWRERRFVFRETPLSEVAAEFNRYNRIQLKVAGPSVREKLVSGIFDVDRPQSIVLFAQEDPSLAVEPNADGWVIRSRASAASKER